jgi:MOSC domain-containing protein YiiM
MPVAESARIVSLNVGTPRQVQVQDALVRTSIFKSPVEGRRSVRFHNIEGDQQADLTVHGGPHKAVYLYASEHYRYWSEQLPGVGLPFGMFGENLTTAGIDEESVHIGDRFRIGSAILQVAQPRMPCYKLNLRFGRPDIVKKFWHSGLSGIYFSIVTEGDLAAGDSIEQVSAGPEKISVADVVRLFRGDEDDPEILRRALDAPLHGGWKQELARRA